MDSIRKGKKAHWFLRLTTAGFVSLLGVALGVYLGRINIARYFLEKGLSQTNITESYYEWNQLDSNSCSFSNIFIRSHSFTISIDKLDLNYNLKRAWEKRELEALRIAGLQLEYDLTGPSTVDLQEIDSLINNGIAIPLDSVIIEYAKVKFLTDFGELIYELKLDLFQGDQSEIYGKLNAASLSESLDLEFEIFDRINFSANASTTDLEESLKVNGLKWKDMLPAARETAIQLSGARFKANGSFVGIRLETADFLAEFGPISIRDEDLNAEIESIQSSFEFSSGEIRNAETSIHLHEFSTEALSVFESELRLTASSVREILISIPNTGWETNNGEHGFISARIVPVLKDDYTIERYYGDLFFQELASDAFTMSPFKVDFEGTLKSAALSSERLVNQLLPWLSIEELEASFKGLDSDNPTVDVKARIVAAERFPADANSFLSGSWDLTTAINTGTHPRKARLTLSPTAAKPILKTPIAEVNGNATLKLDIDYWSEERKAALTLGFEGTNLNAKFGDWSLRGGNTSTTLSTLPLDLAHLFELRNNSSALVDYLSSSSAYQITIQGSELKNPDDTSLQWFSAVLNTADPIIESNSISPIHSNIEFGAGIVRVGEETIQQFSLKTDVEGDFNQLETNSIASLLFEGEPVSIQSVQSFEGLGDKLTSKGKYTIKGINLVRSDVLSRHLSEMEDSAVSGTIEINGETQLANELWDATAQIQFRDGSFGLPLQELSIEAIEADIRFFSLANQTTDLSQSLTAGRIKLGDLEATRLQTMFSLEGGNQLSIESAGLSIFDGSISLDPFSLSFENLNTDLLLRFNRISINPVIAMLDFFDGKVTGRLNGNLPISLIDGYPVLGEGFLELDPSESAQFSYNAKGFFTDEENPAVRKKALADKLLDRLGLEPNALLEDALGDLNIQKLRLDLFNKNLPRTPMRIQLAGIANTGQAEIPLNITTNVNGTVAELFNFLTRLDSLGLVAGQQPSTP